MDSDLRCRLCGDADSTVVRNNLRYGVSRKVLRCNRCDFVFLEPQNHDVTEYYSGKNYRQTYGPSLNKSSSSKEIFDTYLPFQQKIIDRLGDALTPSMKVLDVGCSTGHFLHALRGRVAERVGLELNQEHVDFIKRNLDFTVYAEPIEEAVIKEGPFDLITVLQVLEHIERPLEFLNGVAKHLKPGGCLYMELPNINDVMLSVYNIAGYADFYYREPHVSYFSQNTLGSLLEQAKFRGRISTAQDYGFLNHMHWLITGKPQANFTLGTGDPKMVERADEGIRQDLNEFIKKADGEYRAILIKYGLGENLTFLGQKYD